MKTLKWGDRTHQSLYVTQPNCLFGEASKSNVFLVFLLAGLFSCLEGSGLAPNILKASHEGVGCGAGCHRSPWCAAPLCHVLPLSSGCFCHSRHLSPSREEASPGTGWFEACLASFQNLTAPIFLSFPPSS